jgi:hypothetical protein
MRSPNSNLLMIGLRGSGKTTYLAALWHYLESAEIGDRLSVPILQPDRDYLNAVRNNWLALKPVGRTSLRTRVTVSLMLEDNVTARRIEVTVPDLSGESFRLQWSTRKAPKPYATFARTCTGAFLFIHATDFARTHPIKAEAESECAAEIEEGKTGVPVSAHWTPAQSATQVQLTDVVQLLMGFLDNDWGMRLAIVVSAWDLVKAKITPVGWLDSRLPLLSQYLRSNQDWLSSEVFGISAQGGDLNKDRDRLLGSPNASARCHAVQGNKLDAVSISAPLQFLLGSSDEAS